MGTRSDTFLELFRKEWSNRALAKRLKLSEKRVGQVFENHHRVLSDHIGKLADKAAPPSRASRSVDRYWSLVEQAEAIAATPVNTAVRFKKVYGFYTFYNSKNNQLRLAQYKVPADWYDKSQSYDITSAIAEDDKAFKKAICDAIADILVATQPGDTAVITYSGHGTWVPDEDGDEADGRDEALCPWDMMTTGEIITDDYLYTVFTDCIKEGAHVSFISDSCHSGSVARMAPRATGPFAGEPWKFQKTKFLPPVLHLTPEGLKAAHKVADKAVRPKDTRDSVLLMAGCQDTEYSYDAWFNGKGNGAFTYTALWCLNNRVWPNGVPTYREWYDYIRTFLPHEQYPQTPQLSGPGQDERIFGL